MLRHEQPLIRLTSVTDIQDVQGRMSSVQWKERKKMQQHCCATINAFRCTAVSGQACRLTCSGTWA